MAANKKRIAAKLEKLEPSQKGLTNEIMKINLLNAVKIKGKERRNINICLSLKPRLLKDLDSMAKTAKVTRSFLINEFLEAAITLEKGMGLENYAKANLVVNGFKPFNASQKQTTAKE